MDEYKEKSECKEGSGKTKAKSGEASMDLSYYLRKSGGGSKIPKKSEVVKRCMQCGRDMDNDGNYLYYQSFCSEKCKRDYVEG